MRFPNRISAASRAFMIRAKQHVGPTQSVTHFQRRSFSFYTVNAPVALYTWYSGVFDIAYKAQSSELANLDGHQRLLAASTRESNQNTPSIVSQAMLRIIKTKKNT